MAKTELPLTSMDAAILRQVAAKVDDDEIDIKDAAALRSIADTIDALLTALDEQREAKIPLVITDADLHPDTAQLVTDFAKALAEKLLAAEMKYGYSNGWMNGDWMDECRNKLREHLQKGDPRDVAAYCAFLWWHNESTALND